MNPDQGSSCDSEKAPASGERRSAERIEVSQPLKLTVLDGSLSGTTENVSTVGVLFFSADSLRVSVEMEEGGRVVQRTGRLVRVQRMNLDNTGFAVEFDT